MFAGPVQVKIYADLIPTGNEKESIGGIDPTKLERIQETVKSLAGVSNVSVNSAAGTIDAAYSGPFEKVEDIEKAIARTGVHCALVSPAIVKFRPYNQDNDSKVISALRGVPGQAGVSKISGNFCVFISAESLDIPAILDACKNAGYPGAIVSHDYYELAFTKLGDAAKLEKELRETKFVLRGRIDVSANVVKVAVVRGRCSRALLKKKIEECGFESS